VGCQQLARKAVQVSFFDHLITRRKMGEDSQDGFVLSLHNLPEVICCSRVSPLERLFTG
jgi:hypothetical protein